MASRDHGHRAGGVFNMHEPQVRERDYFWVGAVCAFSIWVASASTASGFLKAKLGDNEGVAWYSRSPFHRRARCDAQRRLHVHDRH